MYLCLFSLPPPHFLVRTSTCVGFQCNILREILSVDSQNIKIFLEQRLREGGR
jgi:hypothetical protein